MRASDGEKGGPNQSFGAGSPTLSAAVNWYTPAAQDAKNSTLPPSQGVRESLIGDVMRARNWPTPRTSDTNGTGKHGSGGLDLRTTVGFEENFEKRTGTTLNPAFVETLMGMPLGWTDLDCDDPQPMPWPAGYVKGGPSLRYAWEPPRVVPSLSCKDRGQRIAALGDGQVPQITEYIGRRIVEAASC